jgi:glycerate 2-kinase
VDVRVAVSRNLRVEGPVLHVGSTTFDLHGVRHVVLIAMGKAGTPMYEAAAAALRTAEWMAERLDAIVVSPTRPQEVFGALSYFEGSHPTPDEASRRAATAILQKLRETTGDTLVIFLISGGASSMVELPLDGTISIEDVAEFNRALVGSGLSITEINALRKRLSAIKGGRLAEAAAHAMQCTLIVSDVPVGALDMVGSGPTLPHSNSRDDCMRLWKRLRSQGPLPARIERFFQAEVACEIPRQTNPVFARTACTCILSEDDLASAAAKAANAAGLHVEIDNRCDDWTSEDAAAYLLHRSGQMQKQHAGTCLISVGEVGVKLPKTSGQGGRNQHFALQCALHLADDSGHTVVLSAGSDGMDGNSPAAGAVVDEETCRRARLCGFDPAETLMQFNSFPLFDALGDTVVTGPTGNNLRDLRILLRC